MLPKDLILEVRVLSDHLETDLISVEDLIHEENLNYPILQVAIGRFVPNTNNIFALAVLHPRKLSVYEFIPQGTSSPNP
jgi:hypothetical protein